MADAKTEKQKVKEITDKLGAGNGWYEAEINGRGTYFHILAGRHRYGN